MMINTRLGVVERRFAELIWENEPLSSGELVKLCEQALNWKKSTTYTVLRRLCQQGIFRNEGGAVSACLTREEFHALQSEEFLNNTFDGSLPQFLATFTRRHKLSQEEIAQLQSLIDEMR